MPRRPRAPIDQVVGQDEAQELEPRQDEAQDDEQRQDEGQAV